MSSGRIVVGDDGSEGSARAIDWCIEYASRLGWEVVAVHAVPVPGYAGVVPFWPPMDDPQERANLTRIVREGWCAPLAEAGVKHDALVVQGSPAWMLMDVADREDADMIVVGSRGRGGFSELPLGSTSHQLAHHSRRPLMIIPPGLR